MANKCNFEALSERVGLSVSLLKYIDGLIKLNNKKTRNLFQIKSISFRNFKRVSQENSHIIKNNILQVLLIIPIGKQENKEDIPTFYEEKYINRPDCLYNDLVVEENKRYWVINYEYDTNYFDSKGYFNISKKEVYLIEKSVTNLAKQIYKLLPLYFKNG